MKIEERRLATLNNNRPYCQQYQVLGDGTLEPLEGRFDLEENEPALERASTSDSTAAGLGKRADPSGSCHCQWSSSDRD